MGRALAVLFDRGPQMIDDGPEGGSALAGAGAPFASLGVLTGADRRVLAAAMALTAREASGRGRTALADLAGALRAALLAQPIPAAVSLDALADLDDESLEHAASGIAARLVPMVGPLEAGPRAFFDDLARAVRAERERRRRVLSAIDARMVWYDAHWPPGLAR
jgi:hypothetical protein